MVALKLLRGLEQAAAGREALWLHEARLLARVRHPHVATVYGADQRDGRIGFWMELIEGNTLSELLRGQGPFGPREATLVALDLCGALAAVHAQGILHRDLKAQNVMRERGGRIVLMDFGLGMDLWQAEERDCSLSGTPLYMAPEVLAGAPATVRSDVYSLGVLLYHLVTGTFPVRGGSVAELEDAHRRGEIRMLRDVRPDLPSPFVRAVESALARSPAARPASAGAFEAELRAVLQPETASLPPAAAAPSPLTPGASGGGTAWRHRFRAIPRGRGLRILRAVAAAVALLVFMALWWRHRAPTSPAVQGVLLGDVENRTGIAIYGETVRQLLELGLRQSPRFELLRPERRAAARRALHIAAAAPIDRDSGLAICLREHLGWLISGEIDSTGKGYGLAVRVIDARSGAVRAFRAVFVASHQDLVTAVDGLAAELRQDLGEAPLSVAQNRQRIEPVTTRSIESLYRFYHALDLHAHGEIELAIESLQTALARDPDFAMAHCQLAIYQGGVGKYAESLASSEAAFRLRGRLPERESYAVAATYHLHRLQYEEALGYFQKAVALEPADADSWRQIALLHANLGDAQAGLEAAHKACAAQPGNVIDCGIPAVLLAAANHPDAALREIEAARDRLGDQSYFNWGEGLARLGRGDAARAESAFRRLMEGDPTYVSNGRLLLAQTLVYEGRLRQAASELESGLGLDSRKRFARDGLIANLFLARIYGLLGERLEAQRDLAVMEQLPDLPIFLKNLRGAALVADDLGDRTRLASFLGRIERLRDQFPSDLARGSAAHLRGELERAAGSLGAARDDLEEARLRWGDPSTLRSLARLWAAESRCDKAVPLLQQVLAEKGRILRDYFAADWVTAHLDLARCQKRLGKAREAQASYDAFLDLWGVAAADLPLVRQARIERDEPSR
jgi:tetratricopeptide (TPR) repeat protein